LDDKATNISYAVRNTTTGVDIYMFTAAEENKDLIHKQK
jgi:hypothetical protein